MGFESCPDPSRADTVRVHTHHLTFDADVVRKRYVSWSHGEAEREWAGLVILARHTPDLAPAPISRELEGDAPVVVMSRLPGAPLGAAPLPAEQVQALTTALDRLFPAPVERGTAERAYGPSMMRSFVREWAGEEYDVGACLDPCLVGRAHGLAGWWRPKILDTNGSPMRCWRSGTATSPTSCGTAACALVDFEEFGASDLTYELADIVEHASSRLWRLLDVESFLGGFALTAEQESRLAAFRKLLAVFWLVMLLPGNGGFGRNPSGSTEDQARSRHHHARPSADVVACYPSGRGKVTNHPRRPTNWSLRAQVPVPRRRGRCRVRRGGRAPDGCAWHGGLARRTPSSR